jgi:hypothetical protein
MTEANSEDASKVGYKRPPRHSRFRSGQSGNPRGRERSVRNLRTDVKATLAGSIVLNERGKPKRVSTQEAMLLRLKEKALKGDTRFLELLIRLAQMFNDDTPSDTSGVQDMMAEDREILEAYAVALRSRPSGAADGIFVPDDSEGSNPDG